MNEFSCCSFSSFSKHCETGISQALIQQTPDLVPPVFICIGSDLVLGDSLGPLVGTLLKKKKIPCFVYGSLSFPITAKEIICAKNYLKKTHPSSVVIAIDAAIGQESDIGLIRVSNKGLRPGLGVNKDLGDIGDISIIGVVAEKSVNNTNLFNLTRLNLIYTMAEKISEGIEKYISFTSNKNKINKTAFET